MVPVLHHGAFSQGPLIAVTAPGKPAKMALKLRFSCIMMTTCLMVVCAAGRFGTALVLLHPANAAANRGATKARTRFMMPSKDNGRPDLAARVSLLFRNSPVVIDDLSR